jgi:hypothetical protein
MAGTGAWFAIAESETADLAALTRWREERLAPLASSIPDVCRVERYTAFNVRRTVLLAHTGELADMQPVADHGAIRCKTMTARKCSEFSQPSESDAISAAPILYSVLFNIPIEWHQEFDVWYDQEHIPMILACKEWAMTSRYHVRNGDWTHLALHYIKSASAFDDPALKAARLTPWRKKFLKHRWFTDVDKMIHFKQAAPSA